MEPCIFTIEAAGRSDQFNLEHPVFELKYEPETVLLSHGILPITLARYKLSCQVKFPCEGSILCFEASLPLVKY